MSGDLGHWGEDQSENPADAPARELIFGNAAEFVEQFLAPMYRREARTWCPQWWRHTEAAYRLTALWLSWEQLRLDPALGMSVWLRDHADHHMAVLLSADGPLKGCKPDTHRDDRLNALTSEPPPAGLYSDERMGKP